MSNSGKEVLFWKCGFCLLWNTAINEENAPCHCQACFQIRDKSAAIKKEIIQQSIRDRLALNFEIDPLDGQQELRKMGYYFTIDGQCRSIKDNSKAGRFATQSAYEAFGGAVERFIFHLLSKHLQMIPIEIEANSEMEIGKALLFTSPNYTEKETLMLIIPGSG